MRRALLPLVALLALAGQGRALDLTVEQCVALGLSNNPLLKARETEVESTVQDARIARAGYLPILEARGTYAALDQPERIVIRKGLLPPGFPTEDTEIRGDTDLYAASVTLRQTLYAGGRITHAYQRDNELLQSARHGFGDQRTRLTYNLKAAFYEALIHQAYIDSHLQQLTARREGLRVAMALADEGELQERELLQARARAMFSEAELLQARQRAANATDQLRRLLALGMHEELSLVDVATYPVLVASALPDLSAAALEWREDYRQFAARIRAAEENVKVARSRYLPEIYAEGGYLRQSETDLARDENWAASINLNWPLFEGGRTDAEVVKANLEKQRLEHLRRDLEAEIRNEVQAALRQATQQQRLVEAYLVNLQAEERSYGDLLARQEQGEALVAEVMEQQARLLQAHANYLERVQLLRIALAALEAATASPLDSLVELRPIYRPDPKGLEAVPAVSLPPKAAASSPALPLFSEANDPAPAPLPPPVATDLPPLAPTNDTPAYAIQLGAFKSHQRARVLVNTLKKQHPDYSFEVIAANGFYKVRSTFRLTYADAVATLAELGGQGFVIRASAQR
jgi:outer membrane protein TolC